ncbi:MAG: polysaccharide deacetylase family protein [Acutalibacteraceae bacterium]
MFLVVKRKSLIVVAALTLVFVVALAALGASGTAAVFFGESTRKIPVYRVARAEDTDKVIALTFDAAWGADKTQGIIDILNEYDADATFFLVGFWIDKYEEEVKAIAEAGLEIGNHSKNHLNMPRLNEDSIREEISSVNGRIEELTGVRPTFFRAPYGDYSNRLLTVVDELDMVGIQWSIDSLDWKGISAKEIVERVVPKAKSGDIVLFHNNSDHVLDALPLVIMGLKNKGFRFVGLSDMVATENFTVDSAGEQHSLD